MNALVAVLLLCLIGAWLVSFTLRDTAWAFPLWFPLTATSAIGTLVWLGTILSFCGRRGGGGEAEGWAAFGAAMAFLYLLVCPVVFVISVCTRPRRSTPPAIILATIAVYVAICIGVVGGAKVVERVPVYLTVTDSESTPIPGAMVSYETFPRGSGFSGSKLRGEVRTDGNGSAIVFTQRTHQTNITVRMAGFEDTRLSIDRSWGFSIHQSTVSWSTRPPTKKWPENHSAMFDIPTGSQLNAKIYLPRTGQDKLPYPDYKPTWLPK